MLRLASWTPPSHGDLSLQFRTPYATGVLFSNGDLKKEYVQLHIVNSTTMALNFDIGSGTKSIFVTIKGQLNDRKWHKVFIYRNLKEFTMQVDEEEERLALDLSSMRDLNVDGDLYLGSDPKAQNGFVGCIRGLVSVWKPGTRCNAVCNTAGLDTATNIRANATNVVALATKTPVAVAKLWLDLTQTSSDGKHDKTRRFPVREGNRRVCSRNHEGNHFLRVMNVGNLLETRGSLLETFAFRVSSVELHLSSTVQIPNTNTDQERHSGAKLSVATSDQSWSVLSRKPGVWNVKRQVKTI